MRSEAIGERIDDKIMSVIFGSGLSCLTLAITDNVQRFIFSNSSRRIIGEYCSAAFSIAIMFISKGD